jgi:hypothetical protein
VCGGQDPRLNSFAPVSFAEKTASNLSYYFYNIQNPIQYLLGDDAVVVEKGPYMIKYVLCLMQYPTYSFIFASFLQIHPTTPFYYFTENTQSITISILQRVH